jgi:ABC-type transport system involved in multi-copper enzyme maturation permease subunit
MLKDTSLGAMSIFTSMLAILATANLLPKDVEDRTLYTILAKPVPRFEYLTGKLLGVLLLLLISIALMGVMFAAVLAWRTHVVAGEVLAAADPPEVIQQNLSELYATAYDPALWAGGLIIYAKAALLASLTLFVSTFATSSIFTIMVSVAIFFIGQLQGTARDYWQTTGTLAPNSLLDLAFFKPIALIFPDLQAFNLVEEIIAGTHLAPWLVAKTVGFGAVYVLVYLFAGYFMFAKREI